MSDKQNVGYFLPIIVPIAKQLGSPARTLGAILDLPPFPRGGKSTSDDLLQHRQTIADHSGVSAATVSRDIEQLVRAGILRVVARIPRNTIYHLTVPEATLKNPNLGFGFYRFPVAARDITSWPQVVTLSLICWRCNERDAGYLCDYGRGSGASYVSQMTGLSYEQSLEALRILNGTVRDTVMKRFPERVVRKYIDYDRTTYRVQILPEYRTGRIEATEATVDNSSTGAAMTVGGTAKTMQEATNQGGFCANSGGFHANSGGFCANLTEHKHSQAFSSKPNHSGGDGFLNWGEIEEKCHKSPAQFIDHFVSKFRELKQLHRIHAIAEVRDEVAEIAVSVVIGAECGIALLRHQKLDDQYVRFLPLRVLCEKATSGGFLDIEMVRRGEIRNPAGFLASALKSIKLHKGSETAFSAMRKFRNAAKEILPDLLRKLEAATLLCSYCEPPHPALPGSRGVNGFNERRLCANCERKTSTQRDFALAMSAAYRQLDPHNSGASLSDDDVWIDGEIAAGRLSLSREVLMRATEQAAESALSEVS